MKKFLALLLCFFFAIPSWAALGIGASAQNATPFAGSLALPSVTTQATGSTFVIFITNSGSMTAPTDNKGNTFTTAPQLSVLLNGSATSAGIWICNNGVGGAGHIFTVNSSGAAFAAVVVEITSSVVNYGVLDKSATTPNLAGVTTANSPSITPAVNGEVVLSFVGGFSSTNNTITDPTGYNNILASNGNGATNSWVIAVGGLVQTTAGATNDIFALGGTTNAATATISFTPKTPSGPSPTAFRIFP